MVVASNLVAIYQISVQVKQFHVRFSHIRPRSRSSGHKEDEI